MSLYELLPAYAEHHPRRHTQVLTIALPAFHSIDEALRHLGQFIGHVPEWRELIGFLPADFGGGGFRRSALPSPSAAPLDLARAGRLELRQDRTFGPIYLRSPGGERSGGQSGGQSA